MVPVIRDCHKKTVADLEKDLADLAKRARNNQIALEEMVGGTFTISNGRLIELFGAQGPTNALAHRLLLSLAAICSVERRVLRP